MCCRWKDDTMINTYRATQMECTEKGPAFRIFSLKKQNGLVVENVPKIIKKRKLIDTCPNSVVDLTEAPPETKPSLSLRNTGTNQLQIVIPRSKAHVSTQTDNVQFEFENSVQNVLSEESLKSWQEYLKLWRRWALPVFQHSAQLTSTDKTSSLFENVIIPNYFQSANSYRCSRLAHL